MVNCAWCGRCGDGTRSPGNVLSVQTLVCTTSRLPRAVKVWTGDLGKQRNSGLVSGAKSGLARNIALNEAYSALVAIDSPCLHDR